MKRYLPFIALAILGLAACQQRGGGDGLEPLDTQVVEPPPEASIDISQDAQSRRRVESLSGVLPSDVPKDLPLHRPATLIDFGAEGARYITFTSPASPQAVRSDMERRLSGAGWVREGSGDSAVFVKDGRRVTLTVDSDPVGSLWRIDY
ncbi:MAG: hypothetical protein ACRD2Z_10200 [Thermoanaerobaculia bacterium]